MKRFFRPFGVLPLLLLIVALAFRPSEAKAFPDVTASTDYAEAIQWTVNEGITQGYQNGNWGPDDCVTRAQLLKMMMEQRFAQPIQTLAGRMQTEEKFSDLASDHWGKDYVRYARFLEVVSGYPDGTFKPDACVSRVEAMKMAVNALMPGGEEEGTSYLSYGLVPISDMDGAAWYAPYARPLLRNMLLGAKHVPLGDPERPTGTMPFLPADPMSRKEVAEMLYRIDQLKSPAVKTDYELRKNPEGKQNLIRIHEGGKEEVLAGGLSGELSILRGNTKDFNSVILAKARENLPDWIYGFDLESKELKELYINLQSPHHYSISPNGEYLIQVDPSYQEGKRTIDILNLEKDNQLQAVILADDESLKATDSKDQMDYHMEWIDNDRIKYAVFDDSEDSAANRFIEYRTFSVSGYEIGSYTSPIAQKALPYYYRKPAFSQNGNEEGIFVYMHGAGGGVEQGMSDTNYKGTFKNLKDYLRDNGYYYVAAETSSFGEEGGAELAELLKHLDRAFGDISQFFIGASAGGSTLYHALEKVSPHIHVDGAVFIVPTLSESMINDIDFVPTAESDIDFWIEAGELDTALPPDRASLFKEKLEEMGHEVMLNIIPGGDHNAPVEQIDWPTVIEFITKAG